MGGTGRAGLLRLAIGVVLVVTGVLLLVVPTFDLRAVTVAVVASLVVLAGVALVLAPWGVRLWRDLESERSLRIRETERAEIAAHLHDSVLQTLALIQRRPGDAAEVARLARAQERDLRDWIYGADRVTDGPVTTPARGGARSVRGGRGRGSRSGRSDPGRRRTVRRRHRRRSFWRCARHSSTPRGMGAPESRCTWSAAPEMVEAFVRDRGPGFDLDTVPQDRFGVRRSIIDRMARHGGQAVVRAAQGGGTEVALTLPRAGGSPRHQNLAEPRTRASRHERARLLVDDHPMVRTGVRAELAEVGARATPGQRTTAASRWWARRPTSTARCCRSAACVLTSCCWTCTCQVVTAAEEPRCFGVAPASPRNPVRPCGSWHSRSRTQPRT